MIREVRKTSDGSSTLYVPELDEHYHSVHGALQESLHVFIEAGLNYFTIPEVSVLEIGFGTGLNALLTALEAEQKNILVEYTSLEKYPISPEEILSLNYSELLKPRNGQILLSKIHAAKWGEFSEIIKKFSLRKIEQDFLSISFKNEFNVIYFDAFAPSAQPNLWTIEMFELMYDALKPRGILVTYCAKGQVKRNMKSAGFSVEALQGPPGKREMTRAKKAF